MEVPEDKNAFPKLLVGMRRHVLKIYMLLISVRKGAREEQLLSDLSLKRPSRGRHGS